MGAIVIKHVLVADLPPQWRAKLAKATGTTVTVRIEEETQAAAPDDAFVTRMRAIHRSPCCPNLLRVAKQTGGRHTVHSVYSCQARGLYATSSVPDLFNHKELFPMGKRIQPSRATELECVQLKRKAERRA